MYKKTNILYIRGVEDFVRAGICPVLALWSGPLDHVSGLTMVGHGGGGGGGVSARVACTLSGIYEPCAWATFH